jgi:hypothetical protein
MVRVPRTDVFVTYLLVANDRERLILVKDYDS